ncbi:MAG: hypothetical protein KF911_10115 [Pseudomonadales bacterium]|nr:hypothetical protein [Pseudomonadales bacterium]
MPGEPLRYLERTRSWYAALGYPPYRWATNADAPFTPLAKPLAESSVVLLTTAAPFRPELGDQGPGAPGPIRALREAASAGQIGQLAAELIGIPTNRNQRVTREEDALARGWQPLGRVP